MKKLLVGVLIVGAVLLIGSTTGFAAEQPPVPLFSFENGF